jgi:DNA-binding NarL/FixJ family response regulator
MHMSAPTPSSTADDGSPVRVVLVDRDPIFRLGLAQLLAVTPGLRVIGETEDPEAALALLREQPVELVVVDVTLHAGSGIEAIRRLRAARPELKLLAFSAGDEQLYGVRALRAGAHGYLMKHAGAAQIVDTIRKILRGKFAVSDQLAGAMLGEMFARPRAVLGVESFSDRELEVFELLARCHSTRSIAGELGISVKTVETHLGKLRHKVGARTSTELRRLAVLWTAESAGRAGRAQ